MSPRSFARVARSPRWLVISAVVLGLAVLALLVALPGSGSSASGIQTAVADRGAITVSVNGSGLVSASAPAGAAPAAPAKGGGTAPASAATVGLQVFPQTTGQVLKVLVLPGQKVRAGQPIAQLGDPTAASSLVQAQVNVQTARLALGGNPPNGRELAGAQLAIKLAREKLALASGPATAATLTQARLDLANAQLASTTLRRGAVPPSASELAAAKLAITLAQQKLAAAMQPPSQSSQLAAQQAVSDAQAKLNALLAPPPGPLPSELSAAELAVTLAQQQLAALVNPTTVEKTKAQLAVAQAQAALDTLRNGPPPADAAAVAAARQALALATANQAALGATVPSAASVAAAQRDVRAATASLASLQASPSAGPAALATARQAAAAAAQRLSQLVSQPQLAAVSQARLDLESAKLAYRKLRAAPLAAGRPALVAAGLAVRLAQQKLAQLGASPDRAARTQAQLDVATAQLALQGLQGRGAPAGPGELSLDQLKLQAAADSLLLARLHERALTVRSPSAGTVTSVLAAPGVQVDPTVALATVADLAHLTVTVNMSEFDVANMKAGDPAVVNIAALGGTALAARVTSVAPVGVSNAGVVQFPVTVALLKSAPGLRPGMLANVDVVTAQRKGVVRVPLAAIGSVAAGQNAGQTTVTVLSSGKQVTRFVDLGLAGATNVQVLHGVKPGDRVVLPQLATTGSGGAGASSPAGIGVPPPSQDQGNQGGGGGG